MTTIEAYGAVLVSGATGGIGTALVDALVAGGRPVVALGRDPQRLGELTRALLPTLRASRGHVVLVNAAPGLHAAPNWAAFAASKAGHSEVRGAFGRDYDPAIQPATLASAVVGALDLPRDAQITELHLRPAP